MKTFTLYHNPRCSKSRAALALLEERNLAPELLLYLDQPPSADTLRALAAQLGVEPRAMMRTGESVYGELSLAQASDDALFEAMAQHPKLIERPILSDGERAVIGRPPENVLALIDTA